MPGLAEKFTPGLWQLFPRRGRHYNVQVQLFLYLDRFTASLDCAASERQISQNARRLRLTRLGLPCLCPPLVCTLAFVMAKIDPSGRQVPFFVCLSIMLPTDGGKGVLPLFMGLEDANTAIIQVLETKGGNPEEFEVYPMSLGEALDTLIGNPADQIFRFMAPSTSKQYIDEFISNQ
jgi:hypothetical protein